MALSFRLLNLFRHHRITCAHHGKRTDQPCSQNPHCPIFYEGVDGGGETHPPQALLDPRTGLSVSAWVTACAIITAWESPVLALCREERITIPDAISHVLVVTETKASGTHRRYRRVMRLFQEFMEAAPRRYRFLTEVRFPDLTDFCSGWAVSRRSKAGDLKVLISFLRFCFRARFTPHYLAEGLWAALRWPNDGASAEPFSPAELECIWKLLDSGAEHPTRSGPRIHPQIAVFVYFLRYTGMTVSRAITLAKSSVRGNRIHAYRLKDGSEVSTLIPEWLAEKLWEMPHDSDSYFFWNGLDVSSRESSKWCWRIRELLKRAGLPHRSSIAFRHHFAVEQLLSGTPVEDVSRLLGHNDIRVTLKSYAVWIKLTREKLEHYQRRVWERDPLHQRMAAP